MILCFLFYKKRPTVAFYGIAIFLQDFSYPFSTKIESSFEALYSTCIIFRLMIKNAELDGAQWAAKGDLGSTSIEDFIRKNHLDKLPKLANF